MYTQKTIQTIIRDVRRKKISPRSAYAKLKNLPYESFSYARIDHHRHFRKGFPEAVYAPGKNFEQLTGIIHSIQKSGQPLIITRLEPGTALKLKEVFPALNYERQSKIAFFKKKKASRGVRPVAVLTAGTGDIPVAEEAAVTLELLGQPVRRFYDCGVAGLHRLIDHLPALRKCRAVICIAGMEGALASLVAGLIEKPVVAVPTSVGYGAHFKGLAPLLTMINSCAQGIAIVNIDNGFGAACFTSLISK